MASHQAHDIGFKKRKAAAPAMAAALTRRLSKKSKRKSPPDWYNHWIRSGARHHIDMKAVNYWLNTPDGRQPYGKLIKASLR